MARFLDANIPMYGAGREHSLRERAAAILRHLADHPGEYVTSVEVFQEILHRYLSQRSWPDRGRLVFDTFFHAMEGRVEPLLPADLAATAGLADRYRAAEARDLLYVAVMQRLGVTEIISTDRGFDSISEVTRIDPADWTPSQ